MSETPHEPHEGGLNGRAAPGGHPPPYAVSRRSKRLLTCGPDGGMEGAGVRVGDLPACHYTNGGRASERREWTGAHAWFRPVRGVAPRAQTPRRKRLFSKYWVTTLAGHTPEYAPAPFSPRLREGLRRKESWCDERFCRCRRGTGCMGQGAHSLSSPLLGATPSWLREAREGDLPRIKAFVLLDEL